MPSLQARKLAVNDRLLLRLHAAGFVGHEQHVLSPLVLAVVNVRALRAVAYTRVCGRVIFVWFLVRNLTL